MLKGESKKRILTIISAIAKKAIAALIVIKFVITINMMEIVLRSVRIIR